MKINDQTNKKFMTPVILSVPSSVNQVKVAMEFVQNYLDPKLEITSPQLKLINQQSATISIQTVRDVISELAYASHLGKTRAFIFISADQLSTAAQHAFLKSLEEPPLNTLLLLVSSAPEKLLATIHSRCSVHRSQSPAQNIETKDLPPVLTKLLTDSTQVTYYQLIETATQYKDAQQALQIIQLLIFWLHQQQLNSTKIISQQQQLLTTLNNLHANANVRLALEDCFFALKKIF